MRAGWLALTCGLGVAVATPAQGADGLSCVDQGLTVDLSTDLAAAFHADQDPPAAFVALIRTCAGQHHWSQEAANSAYLYALMQSEQRAQRSSLSLTAGEIEQIDALARALDMATVRALMQDQPPAEVQRAFDARVVALGLRSGGGRQEAFVQRVGAIFAERRAADDFTRQ